MQTQKAEVGDVVVFDYEEICDKKADLTERIAKAYDLKGLGLCVIRGVPNFSQAREALLPLSYKLANLPDSEKDEITFPEINWSKGWSHGKEKFKGKSDVAKGSFYANVSIAEKPKDEKELDIWPKKIPELKEAVENMGKIIIETGILLAYHIDEYANKMNPNYERGTMAKHIKESRTNIGRLLHYFPRDSISTENPWCGLHNDHGSLTGLCSAMFTDKDGKLVDVKDPESGLFIYSRDGKEYKANIPKDCLAFQIGETQQVITGGVLRATPHYVKIGDSLVGTGTSRNTFAFFMQPNMDVKLEMPKGTDISQVIDTEIDGLPKLEDRFKDGITFDEFNINTLTAFAVEKK